MGISVHRSMDRSVIHLPPTSTPLKNHGQQTHKNTSPKKSTRLNVERLPLALFQLPEDELHRCYPREQLSSFPRSVRVIWLQSLLQCALQERRSWRDGTGGMGLGWGRVGWGGVGWGGVGWGGVGVG